MYPSLCTTADVTVPIWNFVDRSTYNALRQGGRGPLLTDFIGLSKGVAPVQNKLSISTLDYLRLLNERIHYVLFGTGVATDPHASNPEQEYLLKQLNAYLNDSAESDTPFYEILPIDNKSFLVIVENGFLHFLTQSKDTLLQYVLTCLGCLDRFKCEASRLNELYLRLSFIEGYHLLIKARAQS